MPPHCDSLDGPVVLAAVRALETGDVTLVLPYVHEDGVEEVLRAFDLVIIGRQQGDEARNACDRYFFETVVRIHRAGEGAPFTGLKPAGLDVGPVIPLAEAAIASGDCKALASFLSNAVGAEVRERFDRLMTIGAEDDRERSRRYVEAMLGLEVWAHKLYKAIRSSAHEGGERASPRAA